MFIAESDVTAALEDCGIKLTARAEELSMDEFLKLANHFAAERILTAPHN